MKKFVITIARHYGSGGKTIGNMLAKELNVNCYNREILKMASEDSGINERFFNEADEKLKNGALGRVIKKVYKGELLPPDSDDFTSTENLFNYQAKIIKELANQESCVIIGRCADFVLRENKDIVRVFVHAPEDYCLIQAKERGAYHGKDLDKYIQKVDKYRRDYYHYYTGQDWDDARNYDLCLNSEKLGFDGCVKAIIDYLQIKETY